MVIGISAYSNAAGLNRTTPRAIPDRQKIPFRHHRLSPQAATLSPVGHQREVGCG